MISSSIASIKFSDRLDKKISNMRICGSKKLGGRAAPQGVSTSSMSVIKVDEECKTLSWEYLSVVGPVEFLRS